MARRLSSVSRGLLASFALVLVSAAVSGAVPADPPPGRFLFRSYGVRDGLRNQAVYGAAQDAEGFLWFGTQDGAHRYDGTRFLRLSRADGLPSSNVPKIRSRGKTTWFGTFAGLATFGPDGVKTWGADAGLPSQEVLDLEIDPRGVTWVAFPSGVFLQRDIGGKFEKLAGWPAKRPRALWPLAGRGEAWVAGDGIVGHISPGGAWRFLGPAEGIPEESVSDLVVDGAGRVWILAGKRLLRLDPGATTFRTEPDCQPGGDTFARLFVDRDGSLWVPNAPGPTRYDGTRWQPLLSAGGLPAASPYTVFRDDEGSLWILGVGAQRLLGGGSVTSWSRSDGLPADEIWSVSRTSTGALAVGTEGGLAISRSGKWVLVSGTQNVSVGRVLEAPDGTLWSAGGPPQIIHRVDPETLHATPYGASRGVTGRLVRDLAIDGDGVLLAATDESGLLAYDRAGDRFTRVDLPGGERSARCRRVTVGRGGVVWLSTQAGLLRRERGAWRLLGTADGLRHTYVASAEETRDGSLVVFYDEPLGLDRFRWKDGLLEPISHYDSSSGLASDKVYLVGEDRAGRSWVGSGNGIDVIDRQGLIHHLGAEDGLPSEDIDSFAFLAEEGGDVWIGTSSGLARCRGILDRASPLPPRTLVTEVRVGNEDPTPDVSRRLLPYRSDVLLRFSPLTFAGSGRILVQYRLSEGKRGSGPGESPGGGWVEASNREVQIKELPHGNWTFEVRSRRTPGPWGPVATISLSVDAPWWARGWAIAAFAALVAIALWALVWGRTAVLRKRTENLEAEVRERTAELARANEALRTLAVTDPLTGLKNRRYLDLSVPTELASLLRQYASAEDAPPKGASIAFLMVDLDHFKSVNDRCGHDAGDEVLRGATSVLLESVRESDTAARWGGEEFLVVARGLGAPGAPLLAERIRTSMAARSFSVSGQSLTVTCSIGYAVFPAVPSEPGQLAWTDYVELADRCLFAAKRAGRNAWVGVSAGPASSATGTAERLRKNLGRAVLSREALVRTSGIDPGDLVWDGPS